ncbi:MAG: NAD(P)H-hydrate dehydratase [Candidatus Dormibacteraeota bacterium]|nr:NAD(P)H-hydrate dehydratase [Candidatus Dormibacteraeota bacterium]
MKLGIDAVGVDRIALAVRRSGPGFLKKAYTEAELAYCAGSPERLAGRWAGKEAVIKSFDGTGICFPRRRIEILPSASGAPVVNLLGDNSRAAVELSITHHSGLAVAVATLNVPGRDAGPDLLLRPPEALDLPDRPADGHKGTFGTVVVLAGSIGYTGAAYLAATAAARAGAGIVKLLVAESIYPILAAKCVEVMATPVPEVAPGSVGHVAHEAVTRQFHAARSGLIGPGLGRDSSTWRLINDLALEIECPLVIDADGLNALSDHRRTLSRLPKGRVLTPHPGEMSRLTGSAVAEDRAGRLELAANTAREWKAVVVLKGARTVVAAPDGEVSEDAHEVPALASGGTGDVLGGLIAGLLAQGLEPFTAAVSGVYIHAEAGRRVASRLGDAGLLASDLLAEIPVIQKLLREGRVER